MRRNGFRTVLRMGSALVALGAAASLVPVAPAVAQSADQINQIEAQIKALQAELARVRHDMAARDTQLRAAQQDAATARRQAAEAQAQVRTQPPAVAGIAPAQPGFAPQAVAEAGPPLPKGTVRIGGVTVTLGGFIAAEGLYRTRNETADIGSNWNTGIPLPQNPNNHTGEFRGSARQSRVSLLIQGDVNPATKVTGYYETDFLSSGTTSNSTESNSYTLRLRQAYATVDQTDWGLHVLGGQAWSLMTLDKVGITPRQENVPLTIDAQYVPGFNWARQWQVRVAKDFDDHRLWLAASVEEPQVSYYTGPNGLGTIGGTATITNAGGSLLNSTTTYSDDIAPDVIVKTAWDPGYGHYEAFGVARFLHDRISSLGSGHNDTTLAGGIGIGAIVPVVPKYLDFQFSGLGGYGIGRYGSAQLPDAILSQSGAPVPIPELMGLVGLIGHPRSDIDIYSYVGTEQEGKKAFSEAGKGYGYGSPLYSNAGCQTELSTASCTANTSGVVQGTIGAWWRFLQGSYGTLQAGAQYSYTQRSTFAGLPATSGGTGAPSTDENVVLFSLRYLPFQ
jgi:outer membrane murein-binding lipoprotein Lpp